VNFSKFDTSNIEDMSYMFKSCINITSIDFSHINTQSVWCMNNFLGNCTDLKSCDSKFNVKNIESFYCFFCNCEKLVSIDLSNLKTNSLTNMNSMFKNCVLLNYVNFNGLGGSNVIAMNELFMGCANLNSIGFLKLNTYSLQSIKGMFQNCSNLISLDFTNFDSSKETDMSYLL